LTAPPASMTFLTATSCTASDAQPRPLARQSASRPQFFAHLDSFVEPVPETLFPASRIAVHAPISSGTPHGLHGVCTQPGSSTSEPPLPRYMRSQPWPLSRPTLTVSSEEYSLKRETTNNGAVGAGGRPAMRRSVDSRQPPCQTRHRQEFGGWDGHKASPVAGFSSQMWTAAN
jgi:hypothetical protein